MKQMKLEFPISFYKIPSSKYIRIFVVFVTVLQFSSFDFFRSHNLMIYAYELFYSSKIITITKP